MNESLESLYPLNNVPQELLNGIGIHIDNNIEEIEENLYMKCRLRIVTEILHN